MSIRRSTKEAIVLSQQINSLLRSGPINQSLIALCICCFFFTLVKRLFICLLKKSRILKSAKFRTMTGYLKSVYLFRWRSYVHKMKCSRYADVYRHGWVCGRCIWSSSFHTRSTDHSSCECMSPCSTLNGSIIEIKFSPLVSRTCSLYWYVFASLHPKSNIDEKTDGFDISLVSVPIVLWYCLKPSGKPSLTCCMRAGKKNWFS